MKLTKCMASAMILSSLPTHKGQKDYTDLAIRLCNRRTGIAVPMVLPI